MGELEVLRDAVPAVPSPSLDVRQRARERLLRHAERRAVRRSRWRLASAGLAAGVATGALLLGVVGSGTEPANAARTLRDAAVAARGQKPIVLPAGEYVYTRSTNAYLSTHVFEGRAFHVLVPHTREIWLARNGSGWLRQTSGHPQFLTDRDHRRWLASGRPALDRGTLDVPLGDDRYGGELATLGLPTDPDLLWDALAKRARRHSRGEAQQMYTLVGDYLRENFAAPELRAALYEVAARIGGIELLGTVRDGLGRSGTGIALDDPSDGTRRVLIFDLDTGALLGETQTTLAENSWGYPPGTVVGQASYSEPVITDGRPQAPAP
jgi:hypothetical protein